MNAFEHISYAAKTDVGQKRKNNEDAFGVFPDIGVFCVADGMGGGDDGEIASAAVVKSVGDFAASHKPSVGVGFSASDVASGISASVNEASAWICSRAAERNLKGCGSTFVGVVLDATAPSEAIALHAGDSRLYRIRGSSIKQITKDHSAAEMIGAKDEKSVNPMFRGMILRAVGVHPTVDVERTPLSLKEGDRIVICSDGLSKMVDDRKIAAIVHAGTSPDAVADALVAAANEAGGSDNITVVVLFVGKLPLAKPMASMPLPEHPTGETAVTDEAETSNTGASSGFESEADTSDDNQTMNTITMKPPPSSPLNDSARPIPARTPLRIRRASSGAASSRSRGFRLAAVVIAVAVFTAIAVVCGVCLVRRARAKDEAREVERQSSVRALAEASACSAAETRSRKADSAEETTTESIAQSVERELEISQEKGNGTAPAERSVEVKAVDVKTVEPAADSSDAAGIDAWRVHVLPLLEDSCSPTNSDAFIRTIARIPIKVTVVSLKARLHPICDETEDVERRRGNAALLAADVQDIARELRKYSETRMAAIDAALSEHTTRAEFKSKLSTERSGLDSFMKTSERFIDLEPSSAEAQTACAEVMLGVVKWFVQVN